MSHKDPLTERVPESRDQIYQVRNRLRRQLQYLDPYRKLFNDIEDLSNEEDSIAAGVQEIFWDRGKQHYFFYSRSEESQKLAERNNRQYREYR